MKINRLASAALVACSLVATSAFADIVTLNPSAANAGAANGSVLSAANTSFQTDKATTNFASILTIDSAPGSVGVTTVTETGFFLVDGFSGVSGVVSGVGSNYNIYALFTITGVGQWGTPFLPNNFFGSTTGLSVTATFYGSPGATSVNPVTPTSGNPFGITPDASDFILGTATLLQAFNATAQLGPGTGASTSFGAKLAFTAATGTTGVGGFWEAPTPFNFTLGTSATGVPPTGGNGTTYAVSGGKTIITTNVTSLKAGAGSGNVIFEQNRVPEPGSLALIGLAFAALGLSRRFVRR